LRGIGECCRGLLGGGGEGGGGFDGKLGVSIARSLLHFHRNRPAASTRTRRAPAAAPAAPQPPSSSLVWGDGAPTRRRRHRPTRRSHPPAAVPLTPRFNIGRANERANEYHSQNPAPSPGACVVVLLALPRSRS